MFSKNKSGILQDWSLDVQTSITSQVSFLDTGLVFGTQSGKLICIDFSGKIIWTYNSASELGETEKLFVDEEVASSIISTPLISENKIYFGTENGEIHCINSQGAFLWKQKLDGAIRGTPTITHDEETNISLLVVGTIDGSVYLLGLDGKRHKVIKIKSAVESNAVLLDNKIIVGCSDGKIIAFNQKGVHLWTYQTKGKITANIIVSQLYSDGENVLLIGSQDNCLYALSSDGELKWKFKTQGAIVSAPITAHLSSDQGKDILIGSCDNNIYCISAHGEKLWSYETDFWVAASPAIMDKDGFFKIFVGSYDQKLYVLDGQGDFNLSFMPGLAGIINQTGYTSITTSRDVGEDKGKKLFEKEIQGHITSCSQIPDSQRVVVTTKQGIIYKFNLE